jgi:crotonobetainyl-CoA:carnitine CoA-transferase CaiB-like acyl-CoA transferase
VEPVLDLDEALEHAGDMVHGKLLGNPVKLSRTPAVTASSGPELGADTDAVLAEAGYGADEIAALRESGAIR